MNINANVNKKKSYEENLHDSTQEFNILNKIKLKFTVYK